MVIDSLKTILLKESLESFIVCVPHLKTSLGKITVAPKSELLNLQKLTSQGFVLLRLVCFISNVAVSRE